MSSFHFKKLESSRSKKMFMYLRNHVQKKLRPCDSEVINSDTVPMPLEIRIGEKYSFSADVFSFGLMTAEYFSPDAFRVIKEANDKHERPVLDIIAN